MTKCFLLYSAALILLPAFPTLAQRSDIIPLEPAAHGLMKVHATVGGREGTFLFDSGSGVSSISPELATQLGCHPWGQITGFRMTGERLDMQHCDNVSVDLAGRSFAAETVGVFDVSKYLPAEIGHIDGTIALDVFAKETFTLSYGRHFIQLLSKRATSRLPTNTRMPIHVVRDAEGLALTINLPVQTQAGTAWFEVDTGNTSPFILVNEPLAQLFNLARDEKQATAQVTLGDGTHFEGNARVRKLILDGNLGSSFLDTHDVTIDALHGTAWVSHKSVSSR